MRVYESTLFVSLVCTRYPALPPPEPFHISPGCNDAAEDTDTETRQQISSTTPTTARIKRVNVLAHSPSGSIDAVPSIERHSRRVVKKEGIDLSTVSVDDLLPHSQPRADSGSREPHQPEDNGGKNGDGRGRHALTSVAGEHIPAKRTVGDTRITQIAPPSHREDQGTPKNESPDTGTGVVEADGSAEVRLGGRRTGDGQKGNRSKSLTAFHYVLEECRGPLLPADPAVPLN